MESLRSVESKNRKKEIDACSSVKRYSGCHNVTVVFVTVVLVSMLRFLYGALDMQTQIGKQ